MTTLFHKYQGTGNDFIIADNRKGELNGLSTETIHQLCDRHFGIGADGLMLLQEKEGYDFEMKYYNADGKEGSMCGNGGRCITLFALHAGIKKEIYHFSAADGPHESIIRTNGIIALKMKDVHEIRKHKEDFIVNTGSPHLIRFVRDLQQEDMVTKGRAIRFSKEFAAQGINVNFIELEKDEQVVQIRTYERGVENETLSCGTGATAAALICYHNENGFNDVHVKTKGGILQIEYDRVGDQQFQNIWLCGPAKKVFEAKLDLEIFRK
ncbi:MAG: diaminopimelate epimerase [Chitinophagaceae bacterium]|nr:diaminopimelate epimerase [Chitinophagaceae bacterium]NBY25363.1 diaminopimelate epimerase [Chitinophagaceae bacterium]